MSLAYMDFSSCFTIFSPRLELLPCLQEVRVGADVPPHLKSQSRKHRGEAPVPRAQSLEALARLKLLPRLTALILKDVSQGELEVALGACGSRLKSLELHYMDRGVRLDSMARLAPGLRHLSISDSLVVWEEGEGIMGGLESCRLMRVQYRGPGERAVLGGCQGLQSLHMEGGPGLAEDWLLSRLHRMNSLRVDMAKIKLLTFVDLRSCW